jgi:hypothetical protein
MTRWTVAVPLQAWKLSEPDVKVFIEAGNVLNGIVLPAGETAAQDRRVRFTYRGDAYECGRWDLEVCARPAGAFSASRNLV